MTRFYNHSHNRWEDRQDRASPEARRPSLNDIMLKYPTDKSSAHHGYCDIYEMYFAPLRDKPVRMLEIGIGGYEFPDRGGGDLLGFAEYFTNASIHAVDIHPKPGLKLPKNVRTHVCSQDDEKGLLRVVTAMAGMPDIIIDDASHISPLTIKTFHTLFPLLADGGVYIIEDTETSYWMALGADGTNFFGGDHAGTIMNHMKALADSLNLSDDGIAKSILGIHFYKGLIIILRK